MTCEYIFRTILQMKKEEIKMKKVKVISKYLVLLLVTFYMNNSISTTYAQNSRFSKSEKIKMIMANFKKSLNSENHGVRMQTVEHVGKYNMSNFEEKLIEMLHDEQNTNDKKIIALSLFQLGSFNSIAELRNSLFKINDIEYIEFCSDLLSKYKEYDKFRTEYFETFVASIPENK